MSPFSVLHHFFIKPLLTKTSLIPVPHSYTPRRVFALLEEKGGLGWGLGLILRRSNAGLRLGLVVLLWSRGAAAFPSPPNSDGTCPPQGLPISDNGHQYNEFIA